MSERNPYTNVLDDDDGEIRVIQDCDHRGEQFAFLARVYLSSGHPSYYTADGDEAKSVDEIRAALEKPILTFADIRGI